MHDSDNYMADNDQTAQQQMEAMRRELLQFASLVNHDFKEPLRTMLSFSALLGRRLPAEDSKSHQMLQFVEDGAQRMGTMVDGMVEYLRAQDMPQPKTATDLNAVLVSAKHHLRMEWVTKNAQLSIPENLPEIFAVPRTVEPIFRHLINNSLTYHLPENEPFLEVLVEKNDAEGTEIVFRDRGLGVKEEHLKNIFEPFRKLHAGHVYNGCGLGLATCAKLMAQNKGKIWASSPSAGGLAIHLFFPR